jgi:regulator of chromosome condensation
LGEDVMEARRPAHVVVVEGQDVIAVECGGMHTVALTEDGHVYTWGVNDEGALGRPTSGTAWEGSKDAKEDCTRPGRARLPPGAHATAIAAGDGFTLALLDDGSVWGWGKIKDDLSGEAGWQPGVELQRLPALLHRPATARDAISKVAAGARHALLLTRRGDVLSFGMGGQGQLGRVPAFDNSCRPPLNTLLAVTEVPGVRAAIGGDIISIAAGAYTSFAINARGDVAAWGLNNTAQLGCEPTGGEGGTFVWAPQHVPSWEKVAALAGGERHTLALTKGGEVLSCGDPNYGALGNGSSSGDLVTEPSPVAAGERGEGEAVTAIAASMGVSGAVCRQGGGHPGNLFLWGTNTSMQMAKGADDSDNTEPARMRRTAAFGHRPVLAVSFGGQHAALLAGPLPPAEEQQ